MAFDLPCPDVDPLQLFERWYADAQREQPLLPDAVALATCTLDGRPSVRMVLYKGTSLGRLRFFTNYDSRKGHELAANPRVALCFHWPALERQIRVEGIADLLTPGESDAYFASRPRGSQLGAAVSPQSQVIASHDALLAEVSRREVELAGAPVPRPSHWGGYGVTPSSWEFWSGQTSRLHQRARYVGAPGAWRFELLAP